MVGLTISLKSAILVECLCFSAGKNRSVAGPKHVTSSPGALWAKAARGRRAPRVLWTAVGVGRTLKLKVAFFFEVVGLETETLN